MKFNEAGRQKLDTVPGSRRSTQSHITALAHSRLNRGFTSCPGFPADGTFISTLRGTPLLGLVKGSGPEMTSPKWSGDSSADDDELMLNVLRCHETY